MVSVWTVEIEEFGCVRDALPTRNVDSANASKFGNVKNFRDSSVIPNNNKFGGRIWPNVVISYFGWWCPDLVAWTRWTYMHLAVFFNFLQHENTDCITEFVCRKHKKLCGCRETYEAFNTNYGVIRCFSFGFHFFGHECARPKMKEISDATNTALDRSIRLCCGHGAFAGKGLS